MKIIIADTAGFCMGVKRAVDTAFEYVRKAKGPVYTFGPLIHNPQVLDVLQQRGVELLEDIPAQGAGSVIIRAHGIAPQQYRALQNAGFDIIDATCPKVVKVQKIIERYHKQGYAVIILGEKDHPEITGLNGFADNQAHVVLTPEELYALPTFPQAVVVAQTTYNLGIFEEARKELKTRHPHYKIINTICHSTELRQKELNALAPNVDGFIIVGGFNSGNTRRLTEVARATGKPALHIENAKELTPESLKPFADAKRVGLTAGASTPNWTIQAVSHTLQNGVLKQGFKYFLSSKVMPLLYLLHTPLALAALAFISQHFYQFKISPLFTLLAFLYGWSMHVTSKISGTKAAGFNMPLLAEYFDNRKQLIAASCIIAGMVAILLGFYIQISVGIIIAAACILRVLYDFLPLAQRVSGNYSYFIDMPYSKALCVAIAWGVVAGVLPGWGQAALPFLVVVYVWASLMALTRVMCQDLFAIQTDRICGQITYMLLLGYKKGMLFLSLLLLFLVVYPPVLYFAGLIPPITLCAMLAPALILVTMTLYALNRHKVALPFKLEALVSLAFIITALIMALAQLA